MRRIALGPCLVIALAQAALANGRAPGTSTINFQRGHETNIVVGLTFGLLISHDNGASWQWTCEDNLPYMGMYDPSYAWGATGSLFATTFSGLRDSADQACVFDPTTLAVITPPATAPPFMSNVVIAPNGDVYATAADPTDGYIYRSTDDGMTFPQTAMPGMLKDWWQTLTVAPSLPTRVYLTGYRIEGGTSKVFLMFESIDSGVSFTQLPVTDFTTSKNSTIEIAGIDPTNPEIVYARVTLENNNIGDAIYRSTNARHDAGPRSSSKGDSLHAFVVRSNGDLVAGTPTLGTYVSHDGGTSWNPLVEAAAPQLPRRESARRAVGVHANYGSNQIPADGFGIMKTTDLATWTGVLKYQDINAPVTCAAGTVQMDNCEADRGACSNQLGITANRDGVPVVERRHADSSSLRRRGLLRRRRRWRAGWPRSRRSSGYADAAASAREATMLSRLDRLRVPLAAPVVPDQRDGDAGGGADRHAQAARRRRSRELARAAAAPQRAPRARSRERRRRPVSARAAVRHPERPLPARACRSCSRDAPRVMRRMRANDYKDIPRRRQGALPGLLPPHVPLADRRLLQRALRGGLRARRRAAVPRHRRRHAPPDHPADHAYVARARAAAFALLDVACGTGARCTSSRARTRRCACTASICRRRTSAGARAAARRRRRARRSRSRTPRRCRGPTRRSTSSTSVYLFHELPRNARRNVVREMFRVRRAGRPGRHRGFRAARRQRRDRGRAARVPARVPRAVLRRLSRGRSRGGRCARSASWSSRAPSPRRARS